MDADAFGLGNLNKENDHCKVNGRLGESNVSVCAG